MDDHGDVLQLNPPPAGLAFDHITTPSGARLRYALCGLQQKPIRGTVCLFQGRGEFIEKYFETIADLRRRNYAVAALDWRGQGGSSRLLRNSRKGHIKSFAQYDEDLVSFMRAVVLPDCPPPYYALAHSTGGSIVLRALPRRSWFQKVVVLAPLLGINARGVPEGPARCLARTGKLLGLGDAFVPGTGRHHLDHLSVEKSVLTSDPRRFARTAALAKAFPDMAIGGPTIGWLCAALDCIDAFHRDFPAKADFQTPVLMVLAGNEKVSDNQAARRFARRMRSISLIEIKGARHEILMERDFYREQLWAAFDSFLEEESSWRYEEVA
ncbi:alpha/beta fold hydrolase [Rhodoligotrophos defluvii]|uniref:alpha/beta fold hydrolase n=1 Tax=Rhodoligotrophos defluvii TaxID=2561934 RepID=UPI0010C9493B|nr:alpha/beta hydrolase [Rhodoligotrophos defluvii]